MLKPVGKLPNIPFAKFLRLNLLLRFIMGMLSRGLLKKAKSSGVDYPFLFMGADGQKLAEIAKLIDAGVIRPIGDKVFAFAHALHHERFAQGSRHAIGHEHHLVEMTVSNHEEIVAAKWCRDVSWSHAGREAIGDLLRYFIPSGMSHPVVDAFEMIEIMVQ